MTLYKLYLESTNQLLTPNNIIKNFILVIPPNNVCKDFILVDPDFNSNGMPNQEITTLALIDEN